LGTCCLTSENCCFLGQICCCWESSSSSFVITISCDVCVVTFGPYFHIWQIQSSTSYVVCDICWRIFLFLTLGYTLVKMVVLVGHGLEIAFATILVSLLSVFCYSFSLSIFFLSFSCKVLQIFKQVFFCSFWQLTTTKMKGDNDILFIFCNGYHKYLCEIDNHSYFLIFFKVIILIKSSQ
jgi:hypothetical protein